ncbi:dihydrodipicolinate reductase [Staphylothermus marinus F1]|uniref:Dihydrodipicolinate reductase n=1 Tax=Staphylothermus marinus (strain ATCC 43588 / DSM 3639 / JCM 9404 / F1) TaxID=399550 RepID=A3DKP5_STAMF|nr:dihydrodipicolinate reductase [Staphylothermus marinus]ABN69205.1 dihydrodipicolinate reductase [Staphylothermus marinus F1]
MRIGIYGFGSIGRLVAREAVKRGWEIVGAIDIDEKIIGKDIGEILGFEEKYGVVVSRDVEELIDADVVVHATSSYLDKVYDQILSLVRLGIDTVSTCETLSYPYYRYPVLARKLNEEALRYGVTVLGTGINPGFLLDTLPIVLTAPFNIVEKIVAKRSLDASKRRKSFVEKIGIGMDPEEYMKALREGKLTGHVGYAESVYLIADAAGIHLDKVEERQEPIIADKDMIIGEFKVRKGEVIGIKGYGTGYKNRKEIIRLEFHAYLGAKEYEEIMVIGTDYEVRWRSTGTPGDQGTVAVVLNIANIINDLSPGLLLMTDIIPFKPFFKH